MPRPPQITSLPFRPSTKSFPFPAWMTSSPFVPRMRLFPRGSVAPRAIRLAVPVQPFGQSRVAVAVVRPAPPPTVVDVPFVVASQRPPVTVQATPAGSLIDVTGTPRPNQLPAFRAMKRDVYRR